MEAYLDNSATTQCYEEVKNIMVEALTKDYGNPSSMHLKGVDAEKYVKESKSIFAKLLKVDEKEIFFTSGGTESNNLALIGVVKANKRKGKHLITTSVEHPSILNTMKYLEEYEECEVTYLPTDAFGVVDYEALKAAIRPDTILVSTMYVNNEIGAVNDVNKISAIIKAANPDTIYHVDAIQAFGKYKIFPKKSGIDLLSISGHKIHGPKGIGVIYIKDKLKIKPIIFGGEQQKGMRSGTENVPGIAGIGMAAKLIYDNFDEKIQKLYDLKEYFIGELTKLDKVSINGNVGMDSAPHIVSASFEGVRSEVLLHSLEDKGIYVSAGSACASNKPSISDTLKAINLKRELLDSTIRFSFSTQTTKEELEYCVTVLQELLPVLRRYVRK